MTTVKRGSEPGNVNSYNSGHASKKGDARILIKPRGSHNQTPCILPTKQFDQYLNMSSYQMSNGSDQVNGMSRRIDQIRKLSKKRGNFNQKIAQGQMVLSNESARETMSVVSSNNVVAQTPPMQTI